MTTSLQIEAWRSLPGPDNITRIELENGITVLARNNPASSSVVMSGYFSGGSLYDPPGKLGLASFTAMALMRGTQRRSFQQIFDVLESVGASLGFGASVHNTGFGGRCLVEDLPLLLDVFSDVLQHPSFPEDQVERLRSQIFASLSIRAQDTADMASLAFDGLVFAGHPYAQPEEGHPETVKAIQLQDLHTFHRQHYGPRGMVIAIVGGLSPEQAVEAVQQAVGGWQNPEQRRQPDLPALEPMQKTVRRHVPITGKSQTDLIIGALGPRRNSPDYPAASLGNSILGQFGMMGRIGDSVRERSGLAYYASTSLNAFTEGGSWEVSAGVNPNNLQRAIDLILEELQRFVSEEVSLEELQDNQANFIGRLPLKMESNAGVAGSLLNIERFNLGLDYYRRYPALIQSVTTQDILETARRYLQLDHMAIVSSGVELGAV
jgi:zinc protease